LATTSFTIELIVGLGVALHLGPAVRLLLFTRDYPNLKGKEIRVLDVLEKIEHHLVLKVPECRHVVCTCRQLRGVKGAKPLLLLYIRVADLHRVVAQRPEHHAAVRHGGRGPVALRLGHLPRRWRRSSPAGAVAEKLGYEEPQGQPESNRGGQN
jgi:hypothetical protein